MFELFLALKYLVPKKRSLSTALISLLSLGVISLIVWLVLIFLSVTTGIEKNWIQKLVALNAPLRISPTEAYSSSYYYLIDSLSSSSGYTLKTIGEKAKSSSSDPYDPLKDGELPLSWPSAKREEGGKLIDPVQRLFAILEQEKEHFKDLSFQDYEISGALLRLSIPSSQGNVKGPSILSQMSYLHSFCDKNPWMHSLLLSSKEEAKISLFPSKERQGIFLPKAAKESGVRIGHRGYLAYKNASSLSLQEQHIPVVVEGFYDPGILPIGSRCLLVPPSITQRINSTSPAFSPEGTPTNGVYLWYSDLSRIDDLKKKIEKELEKASVAPYWKVTSFKEYEFSKDLFEQFQSDKTLFTLIAILILIVACSNIISLLILLVQDKKREIALLHAMGASPMSIALIFGICGTVMGVLSSLLGTFLAIITLRHLDLLVSFLSMLQGHAAFNPSFFGDRLPNQLSGEALLFVLIATPLLSLIAGLIPAIKAGRMKPSPILRSEG